MLEVNGLAVSYGAARAVHSLDLTVERGEIVVLMGPNGAGKSSVVNAIAGLLQPHAGTVSLNGSDLTLASAAERVREGIALVLEGRGVFSDMTVAENLELGGYVNGRRRHMQKSQYSLRQLIAMFPRLGERMSQDAATLSGGEQQMLVIARALMSGPRLLLLDEPSLGLAPTVVAEIAKAINQAPCRRARHRCARVRTKRGLGTRSLRSRLRPAKRSCRRARRLCLPSRGARPAVPVPWECRARWATDVTELRSTGLD